MTAKERINQNALKRAAALGVKFTQADLDKAYFEGHRDAKFQMRVALGLEESNILVAIG